MPLHWLPRSDARGLSVRVAAESLLDPGPQAHEGNALLHIILDTVFLACLPLTELGLLVLTRTGPGHSGDCGPRTRKTCYQDPGLNLNPTQRRAACLQASPIIILYGANKKTAQTHISYRHTQRLLTVPRPLTGLTPTVSGIPSVSDKLRKLLSLFVCLLLLL